VPVRKDRCKLAVTREIVSPTFSKKAIFSSGTLLEVFDRICRTLTITEAWKFLASSLAR
jgi:hypothetical protein